MLSLLILAALVARIILPPFFERPIPDFSESERDFLAYRAAFHESRSSDRAETRAADHPAARAADQPDYWTRDPSGDPASHRSPEGSVDVASVNYFPFNPNLVSYEELIALGLSPGVARILINYRESGGEFRQKRALLRVYGLEEEDFRRLSPYIDIPPETLPKSPTTLPKSLTTLPKSNLALDLNSIDSLQLQRIYGIGPVFADRIIRYRELLGGFYAREQLREVYGLNGSQYGEIIRNVYIDTAILRMIDLNTAGRDVLYAHPYLNPYQADALVAYRDHKGRFEDVREIQQNGLLPDSVYRRIRPYLKTANECR
jgi:DNA uptake protein ComE-like DNA-binding protein